MFFSWDDRLAKGFCNKYILDKKPDLGFDYSWLYLDVNAVMANDLKGNSITLEDDQLKKIKQVYNKILKQKEKTVSKQLLLDDSSSVEINITTN